MKSIKGFTLIEVLIYTSVLVIASGLMVGILMVMLRIQSREIGGAGISQELTFVANTVKRLVREASFVGVGTEGQSLKDIIDAASGISGTRLVLLPINYDDEATEVYYNSEEKKIYLKNAGESPSSLITSKVSVDDFSITKYENAGSHSIVLLDITMTSGEGTQNPVSRSFQTAIARVSAATFDSNLIPNSSTLDIGVGSQRWKNLKLSGEINLQGDFVVDDDDNTFFVNSATNRVGVGTDNPLSPLQMGTGKYLQIGSQAGAPPPGDCDTASESGRLIWGSGDSKFYFCDGSGWKTVKLQ